MSLINWDFHQATCHTTVEICTPYAWLSILRREEEEGCPTYLPRLLAPSLSRSRSLRSVTNKRNSWQTGISSLQLPQLLQLLQHVAVLMQRAAIGSRLLVLSPILSPRLIRQSRKRKEKAKKKWPRGLHHSLGQFPFPPSLPFMSPYLVLLSSPYFRKPTHTSRCGLSVRKQRLHPSFFFFFFGLFTTSRAP